MKNIIRDKRDNRKLEEALRLAGLGLRVLPVSRNKKPIITDWPNAATTDAAQIQSWFDVSNPPNIGVLTGQPSGFFVLDVDGPEGLTSLKAFEDQYGRIEHVIEVHTPSGGLHIYFKMPGFDLRNSAGKIGHGLDVRGTGGYIIVPYSEAINRDGRLAPYEYISGARLGEAEPPEAPAWLLKMLQSLSRPQGVARSAGHTFGTSSPYGLKALQAECDKVRSAAQGNRNDALNRAAFAVFQLVAGGELDPLEAESCLTSAAENCGLPGNEIRATIKSAREKAAQAPRTAPEASFQVFTYQAPVPEECSPPESYQLPPPPVEVFPPIIQKMLFDASKVFGGLPLEVPVVALFALLSGCVGQSVVVEVKRGWQVAGNFYWGIVAQSGLGKSPCANAFMRPLWRLDKKNKDRWDVEMQIYNDALEERRRAKDKDALISPSPQPLLTQYIIDDATIEAIGRLLAENPRGIIWVCDELAMLFQNLDRYSNSKGGSKSRLLSSYDRAPWKTNRRERDKDQVVLSAALSIFGTIQPRTLKSVFNQSDADSGLLPRFALILAKRTTPPLLNEDEFGGGSLLAEIASHILSWPMTEHDGQPVPQKIKLAPDAYAHYKTWSNTITESTWQTSEIDRLIVPKLLGMVPRLALLLTTLEAALDKKFCAPEISLATMRGAVKLGDWIYQHQKHIWLSMGLENEPIKTPLDEAIMRTALGLEEYLKANDWRILNDDFQNLVLATMGQEPPPNQVGKAAIKLGIKNVNIGKKRGKEFSPEILDKFRVSFYL